MPKNVLYDGKGEDPPRKHYEFIDASNNKVFKYIKHKIDNWIDNSIIFGDFNALISVMDKMPTDQQRWRYLETEKEKHQQNGCLYTSLNKSNVKHLMSIWKIL